MRASRSVALGPLLSILIAAGCPSGPAVDMAPATDMARAADMTPAADMACCVTPTLSAITPALGPSEGGISLQLDGQDFAARAKVTIAGAPVTKILVVSPTRIEATLPANLGAWGKVPVVVT